jgi:hypothetical protein
MSRADERPALAFVHVGSAKDESTQGTSTTPPGNGARNAA